MDTRVFVCRQANGRLSFYACEKDSCLLVPHTMENSAEEHVPVIKVQKDTVEVSVGRMPHPMNHEHLIRWIYLETSRNGQSISLEPGDKPSVTFCLREEEPKAVYAYCNRHGLWMAEVNQSHFSACPWENCKPEGESGEAFFPEG